MPARPDGKVCSIGGSNINPWGLYRLSKSGQPHGEHRALARLARRGHIAAHHARELAGNGKAEPCAAEALRGRGISLTELLEQPCLLLGGHADAGTASSIQSRPSATLRARSVTLPCFVNLHALLRSEQDLSQPHGIDGQCSEVLRSVNDQVVLVLLGKLTGGADDILDQRC